MHEEHAQDQQPCPQQELSDVDRAVLQDFARQREGMCLLCALPFAPQQSQQQQPPATSGAAAATTTDSAEDLASRQQEQGMMAALGSSVRCQLGGDCCVLLHQACAEWSAIAAGGATVPTGRQLLACLSSQCSGCNQRAATLQCAVPGCNRAFHVPCVQAMGASVTQVGKCDLGPRCVMC